MYKKKSNLTFKSNQLLDASLCAKIKGGRKSKGGGKKQSYSSDFISSASSPEVSGYYCCTRNQFIEN